MKSNRLIWVMILGVLGCEKIVEDEVRPKITQFAINSTTFVPGDNLTVIAGGSDDEDLGQVRIRVGPAFSKSFSQWTFLRVVDIDGRSDQRTFNITVPDSALAGYYNVQLQYSDQRGNGSKDSSIFFSVNRPGQVPEILDFSTLPAADASGVITLRNGDTLRFFGSAVDDEALRSVNFKLRSALDSDTQTSLMTFDTLITQWSITNEADSIFVNVVNAVPVRLLVQATDTTGNLTRFSFPVNFQP